MKAKHAFTLFNMRYRTACMHLENLKKGNDGKKKTKANK